MTTITTSAPAAAPFSRTVSFEHREPTQAGRPTAVDAERQKQSQRLGRLTGLFFLITYATSIPPVLTLYVPALKDPAFVLGTGLDAGVSWGAILEILLIVANVASALSLYPVLRKRFPALSLGYVAARILESAFIAFGIVAILALNTLRLRGAGIDEGAMTAVGQALVGLQEWTFRLGPGVVVGFGNGIILGYMMWKTRLVPRFLSVLGLIGGPALLASSTAVVFGSIDIGSMAQSLAVMPEFLWELLLGVWLLVRGFNPAALAAIDTGRS